jgi:hypothetical protein
MINRLLCLVGLLIFSPSVFAAYSWVAGSVTYSSSTAAANGYCAASFAVQGYTSETNGSMNGVGTRYTFYCKHSNATVTATPGPFNADRSGTAPPPDCSNQAKQKVTQVFNSVSQVQTTIPTQMKGCAINVPDLVACHESGAGVISCDYIVQYTGSIAPAGAGNGNPDPSATSPTTDPRVNMPPTAPASGGNGKCPAGSVQGGADSSGIPICIGTGSAPPDPVPDNTKTVKPTVTTAGGDGSATSITSTDIKNKDGSVTSIQDTKMVASDGTVTTSQTVATGMNSKGSQGRTDTDEDKSDLCLRNPLLSMCRNSSVYGTCEAITCDGDAIQCATLRATATMNCRAITEKGELQALSSRTLGNSIVSGADPQAGAAATNLAGTTVNLSNPNLDQAGFLGGGSCFPQKIFTVAGQTVVMSFESICNQIQPLRYAVMACASLIAYLIVARSVLG